MSAFCSIYGVSEYLFNKALNTLDFPTIHGNKAIVRINKWDSFLESWFTDIMATYCDFMPNSDNRYLPTIFTKKLLYEMALLQFQTTYGHTFCYSTFRTFWKKNFKNIKIPKNFKMGICDACLEYKAVKLAQGKHAAQKLEYEHNKLTAASRGYCNELRAKATQQSFLMLYMQFDGKQASYIPHLMPIPKESQNFSRIRTMVYGVKTFAGNGDTHFYISFPHWTAGANFSITLLYNSIIRFFKKIKHERPPQLIIQVDNCAKDGKNKTLYAFGAHLVHWNWFKEVLFVSLIQGHTHDLIDQEFSIWSMGERTRSILSFPKLKKFIKESYPNGNTSYSIVRTVYDWSTYFSSVLVDISQFSSYRIFKIFKNNLNKVVMMVKKNVLDSDWSGFSLPDSYEQNEITLCTSYLQISPSSIPPILISENVTNALVTQRCFKNHYDNEDLSFWSALNRDSTAYLQETYFPNEGKFFFSFFFVILLRKISWISK